MKTQSGEHLDYRDAIVFKKLGFQSDFRQHEKEKLAFSNPSGLKSIFENLFS